jgi:OST3 / OST6 family, transporter family
VRSKRLAITIAVALLLGLCALAVAVLNNLQLALRIVHKRGIWAIVSAAFYLYSISGGIYCLLRGAAPFGLDPQVHTVRVYKQSQALTVAVLLSAARSSRIAAAVQ